MTSTFVSKFVPQRRWTCHHKCRFSTPTGQISNQLESVVDNSLEFLKHYLSQERSVKIVENVVRHSPSGPPFYSFIDILNLDALFGKLIRVIVSTPTVS